jgi:hypothetical protein
VGKLDLRPPGKGQNASFKTSPLRPPNEQFSNPRKRTQPEAFTTRSPELGEIRSIRQSKAAKIYSQNDDYWRGSTIQSPGHQKVLFDADGDSPMTTGWYDPRTHIFRSKKALDSNPGLLPFSVFFYSDTDRSCSILGVLPAPEDLLTRPYSVPLGHRRFSASLEYDERYYDHQPNDFLPYDNFNGRDPSLLLQPETRPISQEQLVNEVKGIYAGLVMVEKKCVEIDNQQARNQAEDRQIKLSHEQWQALIALHRTLLHEHHDFFLASQHPSASPALKKLAAKYAMPARMWRHGIHSFLELLRHRLPDSLDHMLAFIYLAYSMMALLKESVPAFEDTWIECLGDLARYRMALEDEDLRDREVWSGVARYWYNKVADKNPKIGRIQHYLAVLARRNALQQLFDHSRAWYAAHPRRTEQRPALTLFDSISVDDTSKLSLLKRAGTPWPSLLRGDTLSRESRGSRMQSYDTGGPNHEFLQDPGSHYVSPSPTALSLGEEELCRESCSSRSHTSDLNGITEELSPFPEIDWGRFEGHLNSALRRLLDSILARIPRRFPRRFRRRLRRRLQRSFPLRTLLFFTLPAMASATLSDLDPAKDEERHSKANLGWPFGHGLPPLDGWPFLVLGILVPLIMFLMTIKSGRGRCFGIGTLVSVLIALNIKEDPETTRFVFWT